MAVFYTKLSPSQLPSRDFKVLPSLKVPATRLEWWRTYVVKELGMGGFSCQNKIGLALQCFGELFGRRSEIRVL